MHREQFERALQRDLLWVAKLVALEVEVTFTAEGVADESERKSALCLPSEQPDVPDHLMQSNSSIDDGRQGRQIGHVGVYARQHEQRTNAVPHSHISASINQKANVLSPTSA